MESRPRCPVYSAAWVRLEGSNLPRMLLMCVSPIARRGEDRRLLVRTSSGEQTEHFDLSLLALGRLNLADQMSGRAGRDLDLASGRGLLRGDPQIGDGGIVLDTPR